MKPSIWEVILSWVMVIVILTGLTIKVEGFEFEPEDYWLTFSERQNQTYLPVEKEYTIGIKNSNYLVDLGMEWEEIYGELGFYRIVKLNVVPIKRGSLGMELDYTLKEASSIDNQSVKGLWFPYVLPKLKEGKKLPFIDRLFKYIELDKFSITAGLNYIEWKDSRFLLGLNLRGKDRVISFETNAKDRWVAYYRVGFRIFGNKEKKGRYFYPYREYERNNDNKRFQNKWEIGYKKND